MTRGEHLLYLLNDIDDDLIDAASHGHAPAERSPAQKHWRRWAALAACLLLVVGVWRLFPRMGSSEAPEQMAPGTMDPGSANPGEAPPLTSEPPASFDPNYGAPGETDGNQSGSKPPSESAPSESSGVGGTADYDLTSGEITVYTPVPDLWLTTQLTDKAAKQVCTVLTISDPVSAEAPGNVPIAWMDLDNGTVVALFSGDYAIVYRCEGDFSPSLQDALAPRLQGVFPGLEDALRQALEHPDETWNTGS